MSAGPLPDLLPCRVCARLQRAIDMVAAPNAHRQWAQFATDLTVHRLTAGCPNRARAGRFDDAPTWQQLVPCGTCVEIRTTGDPADCGTRLRDHWAATRCPAEPYTHTYSGPEDI